MTATADTLAREGWFRVPHLLGAAELAELSLASDALEISQRTLTADFSERGVTWEVQSASGRRGEPAVAPGVLRKIHFPSKTSKEFAYLRRHPAILTALEGAGLSNPTCIVDQINFKPARVGTGFPFHQDAKFLVGKTQGRIDRNGGLNLIIALDAADAENGAMEVLGRTHLQPLADFPYDMVNMNEALFDRTHRSVCVMDPGDVVFFHPHLAHGSGPNRSDRRRRLITMWFVGG